MYNSASEIFNQIYNNSIRGGTAQAPGGGNTDFLKGFQAAQSHIQNMGSSQLQMNNQYYQASGNYGSTFSNGAQINRVQANQVGNQQMGNSSVQSQSSQDSLNNPGASVNNTEFDMSTREGRMASAKAAHEKRNAAKRRANAAKAKSRVNPYSNGLTQEEYRMDVHGFHADPSLSPEKAKRIYESELRRASETGIQNASIKYEQKKKADKEAEFEKRISGYSAGAQHLIRKKRNAKKAADAKKARDEYQAYMKSPEAQAKVEAGRRYRNDPVDALGRSQADIDKEAERKRKLKGQANAMKSINPKNQGFTGGQWS